MSMTTPLVAVHESAGASANRTIKSLDAVPSRPGTPVSRRYSYGIAIVFSLMLTVLVVVGALLWAP
jgi:hypothetical protein